jgi:hypothetical protein
MSLQSQLSSGDGKRSGLPRRTFLRSIGLACLFTTPSGATMNNQTSLRSRPLFSLSMRLHPTIELGQTPAGIRRIYPVSGGSFEGDRLSGEVSPWIGSDLLLARPDGTYQQDVRLLLVTDDQQQILMTYRGVRRASAEVDERLKRGEIVDRSEYYLRTTPYFETAATKYAWINGIVAVAQGGRIPGGVHYDVHEIL